MVVFLAIGFIITTEWAVMFDSIVFRWCVTYLAFLILKASRTYIYHYIQDFCAMALLGLFHCRIVCTPRCKRGIGNRVPNQLRERACRVL